MSLELRAPDGAIELYRVAAYHVRVNVARDVDLEVVATEDHNVARLACSHDGWLTVSVEGGGFVAVPDDVESGVDLGAFTEGERKEITIRITIPVGTSARDELVELYLGTGVGDLGA